MTKHYDNIIWDWNGTILNDIALCVEIANTILSDHSSGKQLDMDSYRDLFCFPLSSYYQNIGITYNEQTKPLLIQQFITAYSAKVRACELYENISEVLASFKTNNKKQFILTAAHTDMVVPLLDHFEITQYFLEVQGLDNHGAGSKVNNGLALLAKHKLDNSTTVMLGDTTHDFEVAEAMGVDCILIANGHQSRHQLEKALGSDAKIVDEIITIL